MKWGKALTLTVILSLVLSGCMPQKRAPEEDNPSPAQKASNVKFDSLSTEQKLEYNEIISNAMQLYLWAKYDDAIEEFKKAGKIAETPEVYFNIATIYANRGDAPKAFINFYKVYQMDPDYDFGVEYARGFALGLYSNQLYEDAIKWCDIAIKKYYSNGEPGIEYLVRTKALSQRDLFHFDEAIKIAEDYLKKYPDSGDLAKEVQAMLDFLKNNRDDTDEPLILYAKTRNYRQPDEKIEKFSEILEKYPETKLKDEIIYQIAQLYGSDWKLFGLQDFEKQIEYLEKLIKECPDSPYVMDAQKRIQTINYRMGTIDEKPRDDSWYKNHRKAPLPGSDAAGH